jgi:hypothetical protein
LDSFRAGLEPSAAVPALMTKIGNLFRVVSTIFKANKAACHPTPYPW